MSAAFTPGPWKANVEKRPAPATGFWYVIEDAEDNALGEFYGSDHDTNVANARLSAAAPDHALIGWAMCVQDATWEEWDGSKGEFCFAGLRHATSLDEFGCPVLTDNLRAVLVKARDQ